MPEEELQETQAAQTEALKAADRAVYQQQRRVHLLRQQIYIQPDPDSEAARKLSDELMEAVKTLQQLEQERLALATAEGQDVLYQTDPSGKDPRGVKMGRDTTGVDLRIYLRQSHVPTGIIHLLDQPLVTFEVKYVGSRKPVRLRLTSFVERYSAKAVDTVELQPHRATESQPEPEPTIIQQQPTFFPDRLSHVNEITRATLHIQVDDLDGNTESERTFPIWLLARTTAYRSITDPATGEQIDLTPYFGAWVTPNSPEVLRILRRAVELHAGQEFVGYQKGQADSVTAQVKAIFQALQEEGIKYVHSILAFGTGVGEGAQRVRLPRESITYKSANCIDGTVLMASLLEAASLNPAIVLIPNHAFLGWQTQEGGKDWDYLETTMIGNSTFEQACEKGRSTAKLHKGLFNLSGKDPHWFREYALPALRAEYRIMPME